MKFTKRIILIMLFFFFAFMFGSFMKNVKVNAEGEAFEIVETGVKYANFATAKSAATSGQTIRLLRDFEQTSGYGTTLNKNLIIDFSDYTFTFSGSGAFLTFDAGGNYSLTLKASGNGGVNTTKTLISIEENYGSEMRINIESGSYSKFNIYCNQGNAGNLNGADFVTKSELSEKINITGGKFYMLDATGRTALSSFVSEDSFKKEENLGSGTYKFLLDVKPETYVTDENTKASANLTYTRGYSYYQKVTTLSGADAGKKYLIGYTNLTEKAILLLTGEKYPAWSYIMTERHNNIPNNPTDTWRLESDSKFYGDVDDSYFYTLGYNPGNGKYTFENSAGDFLTHTTGTTLTIKTTAEIESAGTFRTEFAFTPSSSYLSTGSGVSTSYITYYTNQRDSKYVFEMYGTAQYSGLGQNNVHLYAHLYEKIDVEPVVEEASIRFGTGITKNMYDYLNACGTSVTFGVIAKGTTALGGAELTYDNASIKKAITPARVASIGAAVEDLEGDYYQFALVLDGITEATYNKSITARVYVCVDDKYYYMNESVYSLQTLAAAYFNAADTSAYTEHLDVLEYLKDYAG